MPAVVTFPHSGSYLSLGNLLCTAATAAIVAFVVVFWPPILVIGGATHVTWSNDPDRAVWGPAWSCMGLFASLQLSASVYVWVVGGSKLAWVALVLMVPYALGAILILAVLALLIFVFSSLDPDG